MLIRQCSALERGQFCLASLKRPGINAGHRTLGHKVDPRNREAAWHGTKMHLRRRVDLRRRWPASASLADKAMEKQAAWATAIRSRPARPSDRHAIRPQTSGLPSSFSFNLLRPAGGAMDRHKLIARFKPGRCDDAPPTAHDSLSSSCPGTATLTSRCQIRENRIYLYHQTWQRNIFFHPALLSCHIYHSSKASALTVSLGEARASFVSGARAILLRSLLCAN
jgi:hypothetical protein